MTLAHHCQNFWVAKFLHLFILVNIHTLLLKGPTEHNGLSSNYPYFVKYLGLATHSESCLLYRIVVIRWDFWRTVYPTMKSLKDGKDLKKTIHNKCIKLMYPLFLLHTILLSFAL